MVEQNARLFHYIDIVPLDVFSLLRIQKKGYIRSFRYAYVRGKIIYITSIRTTRATFIHKDIKKPSAQYVCT